jgi:elongator complex protein 3
LAILLALNHLNQYSIVIMMKVAKQVIKNIISYDLNSVADFSELVRQTCGKLNYAPISHTILNRAYWQLIKNKEILINKQLEKILKVRRVRTSSGVTPIAVLTKPFYCPGKCVYCPLENGMPKSYLLNEPAAQRAKALNFDPYEQVNRRIKALEENGHSVDKIELIVLGGSWSAYPKDYQTEFIKRCFDGANQNNAKNLTEAQTINETSDYRIIGITLETRPDLIDKDEIVNMRRLGCTRVQLGAQHLDNEILKLIMRGHTVEQLAYSTKLLKEAGFKVDYHLMPDLPGTTPEKDIWMAKEIFSNQNYQPDQIKIYPTVVNEFAPLYQWWQTGKYIPMSSEKLHFVLKQMLKQVPPYVRVNRLIRDIPAESIIAGNKITNLRQSIESELINEGTPCVCMRCRENRDKIFNPKQIKLFKREYRASKGKEIFLSFESIDQKILYAFARLRLNDETPDFIAELKDCAIIRELHTYGSLVKVNQKNDKQIQHSGLGQKLMKEAELISKNAGYHKIAVIAGIGVRQYYQNKLGYHLKGTYMVKKL